ncbi:39S ribosomal protein L54, mitochondrial [Anoplophora glabripennis]|uniref:39S ribosomal protein L54, mitochondrial n=1 Tax=Anoplophora glabripennis TaxID=217634 RepID=UPI000874A76A|nr:39S ribosomal protein L54, mitochondrial [Anoplophora glabripennis]
MGMQKFYKMSVNSVYCLLVRRPMYLSFQLSFPRNNYAKKDTGSVSMVGGVLKKKKLGKLGPVVEKTVLPVETDPEKLVKYACGTNIFKTGEDVLLKPDNEYPEWLWNIRLGPPPPLEELDPNSKQYWKRIRKMAMRRNNKFAQLKKF